MLKMDLQKFMIIGSVMLATIMQALDSTIANVALPHMQGTMSATQDQVAWVLTSYIVAAAIFTPTTGFLADRLGRRRLLSIAVIGFTISSMLCGAAMTVEEIVLFRIMQGMFGAALVPLSQSIVLDTFPPAQLGSAMAIWGVGVMVGPILGPALGGWLTENYSWRWVFYINLPFGILALVGILSAVPQSKLNLERKFDWYGFAFLSLGIGALQIMLDRGELQDWFSSPEILIELTIAILGFYLFITHSYTTSKPFLDMRIFKDRNLVMGTILIFMVGVILYATMALLPPFLETLKGYPVITTGMVLAPRGFGTMVAMLIVGQMIGRIDIRAIMAFGFLLAVGSLWEMCHWTLDVDETSIIITGIVQGFGLGFIFVPLSTATFATIAQSLRTEGASVYALMRNLGSSIGISMTQILMSRYVQINHATLSEHISMFNPLLRPEAWGRAFDIHSGGGLSSLNSMVTQQAATIAYLNDFRFMMWMTIAAIPMVFLMRVPKGQPPVDPAHAAAAMAD